MNVFLYMSIVPQMLVVEVIREMNLDGGKMQLPNLKTIVMQFDTDQSYRDWAGWASHAMACGLIRGVKIER